MAFTTRGIWLLPLLAWPLCDAALIQTRPQQSLTQLGTSPRRPRNSTKQLLTVCNAYAYSSKPFHVYNMRSQQRLTGSPLAYKECGDFVVWLREGDQLDFRTSVPVNPEHDLKEQEAEHSVGVFRAWGLPKQTSSLLLVAHRQGTSTTVAFESHIFRELQNSQLAVVDAYFGENYGRLRITDDQDNMANFMGQKGRMEELSFNSVIALNPGNYQLVLANASGGDVSALNLQVARPKQKFLVMRIGVDDDLHNKVGNATTLPQELFLHQQTLEDHSSSPRAHPLLAAALIALVGVLLQQP